MGRNLDFNPAGGYLKELRARGLVKEQSSSLRLAPSSAGGEDQLPLRKVLEATKRKTQSLDEIQRAITASAGEGIGATDLLAAVTSLEKQDMVRVVDTDSGPGVALTDKGETVLKN